MGCLPFALSTGAKFLPSTVANLQWNVFCWAKADAMKLGYFWSSRPRYFVRKKRWKQDMPGIKPSQVFGKKTTLHFPFCLLHGLNLRVFCDLDVHIDIAVEQKNPTETELFLVEIGRTFRAVCLVKRGHVLISSAFPPSPKRPGAAQQAPRCWGEACPCLFTKIYGWQWKITKIDSKAM